MQYVHKVGEGIFFWGGVTLYFTFDLSQDQITKFTGLFFKVLLVRTFIKRCSSVACEIPDMKILMFHG